jgi:hypothetical protein
MHGPTCIFWANLTPFSLQDYDRDHDQSLDLRELAAIVHDVDAGATALLITLPPLPEPRGEAELLQMYTEAVDDDDHMHEDAFLDMCFRNTVGIGAVPNGRKNRR